MSASEVDEYAYNYNRKENLSSILFLAYGIAVGFKKEVYLN